MTDQDFQKQNAALAHQTLEIAKTKLGIKEATGHNDGPFIKKVLNWAAGLMEGNPWCASFATWCMYQAAVQVNQTPVLKRSASSTSIYADAKRKNLVLHAPIVNCIGLIRGTGGTTWKTHHHTFLVESVDLFHGDVHGIDGNWSNAVRRTSHKIKDCDFVAIA